MAVLVTGGAGYIGSHMVWALVDAGEDVVVLDRLSTGFRWAVAPEARFYEGDIADTALLAKIFAENAIDAIIHFAGSIIVPESVTNPLMYYENNTVKSRALIAAAVKYKVPHFVYRRRLWHAARYRAGHRDRAAQPGIALWLVEADDRDHAARHSRCA